MIARAPQIWPGALYGEAEVSAEQSRQWEDLRTAVRRDDIPDQARVPDPDQPRGEGSLNHRDQAGVFTSPRVEWGWCWIDTTSNSPFQGQPGRRG